MPLFELLAKIRLEGAEQATRALESVRQGAHSAAGAISSRLGPAVSQAAGNMRSVAADAALMSAALSGIVGVGAFQAAAKMDSLTIALASVSTNAADLQGQLNRLREVAKLPGLGFEEAVAGSVALQSAGYSAQIAERALMAFGNALANAGKGKAELDGVTLALQQIASKGKISAEEINQIRERVPQIGQALQRAFGTADSEQLQKMGVSVQRFIEGAVSQLERLPKATGGIQNSIENLGDAIKQAIFPLGTGIAELFAGMGGTTESLLDKFKEFGTQIGEVFAAIGNSGVLDEVFGSILKRFDGVFGSGSSVQKMIARFAGVTLSILKNIPDTIGEIGEYLKSLFSAIWGNIVAIAKWAYSSMRTIFSSGMGDTAGKASLGAGPNGAGQSGGADSLGRNVVRGDLLGDIGKTLEGMVNNLFSMRVQRYISEMLGIPFLGGTKVLSDLASGKTRLPAFPEMGALPDIKAFRGRMTDPLKDADRFTQSIMSSLFPFNEIPQGLNFGGNAGMQNKTESVFAKWDAYLAGIEKNTKSTVDMLSSRSVFGGGALARAGLSDAERFAATRPDPYTRSLDSTLRSAIHRAVRADERGTTRRALYSR